jgi:hypothetical protein
MTPVSRAHGLTRYKRGCRCGRCLAANRAYNSRRDRLIAYGRWEHPLDAAGTRRRLQALIWNGWSLGALSVRLGCSRQALRVKLDYARVSAATAAAVRQVYDELWDQPPPERDRFERRAATMARRYARERGFAPPLAWDEDAIDDPGAGPADGWERHDDVRRWGVLADEAGELISLGVNPEGAAERLGVSRSTLGTALARARKREGEGRAA